MLKARPPHLCPFVSRQPLSRSTFHRPMSAPAQAQQAARQAAAAAPPAAAAAAEQAPLAAADPRAGKCQYYMQKVRARVGWQGASSMAMRPHSKPAGARFADHSFTPLPTPPPLPRPPPRRAQKQRHCKFDVVPGKAYCGNHLYFQEGEGPKRVPCPWDPKGSHMVRPPPRSCSACMPLRSCNRVCVCALPARSLPALTACLAVVRHALSRSLSLRVPLPASMPVRASIALLLPSRSGAGGRGQSGEA